MITALKMNATNDSNAAIHEFQQWLRQVYVVVYPIILFTCVSGIVLNGVIVLVAVIWMKKPPSTTLLLTLCLAAADLWTSVILLTTYLLNSYLPTIIDDFPEISDCAIIVMEVLRLRYAWFFAKLFAFSVFIDVYFG